MSAFAAPSANFSSLAVEIQTMVASHMSPFDLVQFSQTSRRSRAISTRSSICADGLRRIGFPSHMPTPAASLAKFCLVFFGGKCTACGKHTDNLPFSYTARIRVCGGPCKDALLKLKIISEIPASTQQPTRKNLLLDCLAPWLPPMETPIGRRTYYFHADVVRATEDLKEAIRLDKSQGKMDGRSEEGQVALLLRTWDRKALILPGIMKTAQDVLNWQRTVYTRKREQLDKNVSAHLLCILEIRGLKMKPAELLRSPTLRETIKFWHRDLHALSLHAFSVIEPLVLREVLLTKAGLPPPAFKYRKSDRILCPICDTKKSFLVQSLVIHIHHKHPDEFPRVRETYNVTPGFKYCELCPHSLKMYAFDGMRKHIAAKHIT
ncbi:hypothetical protein C8R44DRAFT_992716 [Mycena epipterygia]|nr:hypothetical protein C8R44DRAFT_992716 [Mycena epipterygia]